MELGRLAAEKGTNPEIVRLGRDIVTEQSAELELLDAWASRLGVTSGMPAPIMDHDMIDMARLSAAKEGMDFDRLGLDVISTHHSAAIQMALMERNGGRYAPAVQLSRSIIESQSAQLEEFNDLIRSLGGGAERALRRSAHVGAGPPEIASVIPAGYRSAQWRRSAAASTRATSPATVAGSSEISPSRASQ